MVYAAIQVMKKSIHLGVLDDERKAALAYNRGRNPDLGGGAASHGSIRYEQTTFDNMPTGRENGFMKIRRMHARGMNVFVSHLVNGKRAGCIYLNGDVIMNAADSFRRERGGGLLMRLRLIHGLQQELMHLNYGEGTSDGIHWSRKVVDAIAIRQPIPVSDGEESR